MGYLSIQEYSYSPWALNSMLESVWALGVTWWVLMVAIVWIDTAGKPPPYNHVICVILKYYIGSHLQLAFLSGLLT